MKRVVQSLLFGIVGFASTVMARGDFEPARIDVVEKTSRWPVPLIELRTINGHRFVSDNAGVIAIDERDLFGREVFFFVEGHGYTVPADGFGYRGVRLTLDPGKSYRVEVTREMIARRLGRVTGAGQFRGSRTFGAHQDVSESGVVGCDSVQTAVHRGRHFWLWGDTNLFHYPLGIFHASAATTSLQPIQALKPPLHIPLNYVRAPNGRPRDVAKMDGSGPTWLFGMISLPDRNGEPRLVASYTKVKPPLEAYRVGLCVWNDDTQNFEHLKTVWQQSDDSKTPPLYPDGHPAIWTDAKGKRWILFGNPLPHLQCPATFEGWQDVEQWRRLAPQESLPAAADGSDVVPHNGSIAWNAYRKRWVTVFMQRFGKPSVFGELWYAEADDPRGPWGPAVKVLTHNNYTFYNPRIHPEFTVENPSVLLFEGTYTEQFADKPHPTPGYDYNQIMYRLDLDDERLKPAQNDAE